MASAKHKAKRSAALIFSYLILILVHGNILLQLAFKAEAPTARGAQGLVMLLAMLETLLIGMAVYLLLCNVSRCLTLPQQHDGSLMVWGLLPAVNVAWHYTLPHLMEYDASKRVWPSFVAVIMGTAVAFAGLPPPHLTFFGLALLPPVL